MIAEPSRLYDIVGDILFSNNRKTLKDTFDSTPGEIERLIINTANFYIDRQDFEILKSHKPNFNFSASSQILNELKNYIYFTYFRATYLTKKPKEITWRFLKNFIINYKSILYTTSEPVEALNLLEVSLEEIEKNILLNENFFLKNQDLQTLSSTNSEFEFSTIAILLNELKNENHQGYLSELQNNSRLDWENKKRST